ncbi:TPA: DUF262 domain-containing protein [Providencia rettgeri]
MSTETILNEIETTIDRVHTQSLDLSFNEMLDMYETGELDINPDYQRLFRWSEGSRSRFIESLILEMPVPPIYVVETDDGIYQLIDGLQRFSSYLHFRGELTAEHMDIEKGNNLILTDCDIVQSLNGLTFDQLPVALKIKLKRSFVRVEVIRKGSDKFFKYHMFKRLNTGGEALTAQQVRNCTIRMLDATFNDFIIALSKNSDYINCISTISESQRMGSYDIELVLRFFAFKNNSEEFKHDITDFLTEYMEKVTIGKLEFDYKKMEDNFSKTFLILNRAHGERIFGRIGKDNQLQSNFNIYHFESICLGMQAVIENIDPDNRSDIEKFNEVILIIKNDPEFKSETTGGGKNSPGKLRSRIDVSERLFREVFK